jgi:hypothetical protein
MPSFPYPDAEIMRDGYEETPPDNVIRSQPDMGPGKERKRSTAAPRPVKFQVKLSKAQIAGVDTWFASDIADGALAFDYKHPRSEAACSMKFNAPPQYLPLGGQHWALVMDVRILV